MRVHQPVWKYFQQDRAASFQGRVGVAVVLGMFFLVISLVVNVRGAHAQSLCSSGDRTYVVARGDTLSRIGARYNVSWRQLASYNYIANPNLIRINQVVCIPGGGSLGTGNLGNPPTGFSNPYPYPNCTWWADQRFFQLHGFYVPWRIQSNAWQWTARAYQFGWTVSSVPTVGSIIDLQPWVQGAYGLGHVAVVENILDNGDVIASNMNWGSHPYRVVYVKFAPGPGVTFISY